ncbi:acetyltransferase [Halomontanus rarus]|uniref:acetyltransferase n=1 Tax=Halomontanus rarus TaxID=3034020 RepID=UPI0023E8FC00|nr:acetyltransferase [Halovivax sp. TS33]
MKVIYCAGEQARVVLDILDRSNNDEEIVLIDDDSEQHGNDIYGHKVIGGMTELNQLDPRSDRCLVALGSISGERLNITSRVRERGFALFSAIDTDTTISPTAVLGEGVTINARTYVGPDAHIGDAGLIDSAVSISHDVHLESGVTVTPNVTIAGGVHVERNAYLGAGATILDHVTIGERSIVGSGAVVIDDVGPEETVVGVPASPVQSHD